MGVGQGDATTSLMFRIHGFKRLQLYWFAVQRPNEASKQTPQLVSHVFHAQITFAMLEYDNRVTIYNSSQSGLKQVINDEFFAPSLITSRLRVSILSSTNLRKKHPYHIIFEPKNQTACNVFTNTNNTNHQ